MGQEVILCCKLPTAFFYLVSEWTVGSNRRYVFYGKLLSFKTHEVEVHKCEEQRDSWVGHL